MNIKLKDRWAGHMKSKDDLQLLNEKNTTITNKEKTKEDFEM